MIIFYSSILAQAEYPDEMEAGSPGFSFFTIKLLIVFLFLSVPIIIFSWRSLFSFRNHGFYRFFSFECILWLALNNYRYWYNDPFSILHVISWICLAYCVYLVITGGLLLLKLGKANKQRKDDSLYQFERTTELVETGLYKYIRHPLYGSLFFLTWGIFLKNINLTLLLVTLLSSIMLILTMRFEEKENIKYFGKKYEEYIKRSKMIIPYIF